jgi:hypothetical protein
MAFEVNIYEGKAKPSMKGLAIFIVIFLVIAFIMIRKLIK